MIDVETTRAWLEKAANCRVVVVGDAMLDRYVTGTVDRISPEAPVPVVRVEDEEMRPGGAANVAAGVRALGARCRLVSVVGDDPEAAELRRLLASRGVETDGLVEVAGRPTTLKTRILARHQQILRIDRETTGGVDGENAERLTNAALEALESAEVVVLQDYDKGTLSRTLIRTLLGESRRRGIPSIVDPKLRHFFDFEGAFVVKPNQRELAGALGVEEPPLDEDGLRGVADRIGCEHLLLTRGERGMLLVSREAPGLRRLPARAREVYDVSGAGDTVISVLATVLAAGSGVVTAAELANLAAGIQVGRVGAVPVSMADLLEELETCT